MVFWCPNIKHIMTPFILNKRTVMVMLKISECKIDIFQENPHVNRPYS